MFVTTRTSPEGVEVVEYEREEFLDEVWEYRAGEHVSILGPTEAGKTTLGYQLLGRTTTPTLPGVVFVMKPEDDTVERFTKELRYKRTSVWPPKGSIWESKKPPGWTLWPNHDLTDFDKTNMNMYVQFRKAFIGIYGHQKRQKGKRTGDKLEGMIAFADELAGLDDELGMEPEIKMMYSRGRSMRAGIWGATQRPVDVPKLAYSSAHHLFLAHDPDESDRKRFGEIGGGVDPKLVDAITLRLPQYWWLYLRRKDRTLCIVRA
jgi:hypothetical protein